MSQRGMVPESTVAGFRYPAICEQLLTRYAADFDGIAERLLQSEEAGKSLIGVIGSEPLAGCTTILLCLAQRLLALGKSVVIADANTSRPVLAGRLGIQPVATWQDVLARRCQVAEALVRSASDGLTVLPASAIPLRPGDRSIPLQASVTAGALRYGYDLTLIDLGAISEASQGATISMLAQAMRLDASLLITNHCSDTVSGQRQRAQQVLSRLPGNVLGVVENFLETVPAHNAVA